MQQVAQDHKDLLDQQDFREQLVKRAQQVELEKGEYQAPQAQLGPQDGLDRLDQRVQRVSKVQLDQRA